MIIRVLLVVFFVALLSSVAHAQCPPGITSTNCEPYSTFTNALSPATLPSRTDRSALVQGSATHYLPPNSAIFNVTSPPFNAVCDGTTNDTTAIQNTENAAQAVGGTVIFPTGICYAPNGITVTAPVALFGQSSLAITPTAGGTAGSSELLCNNGSGVTCLNINNTGNLGAVHIRDLLVVGKTGTPGSGSFGINARGGSYLVVENVQASNFDVPEQFQGIGEAGITLKLDNPTVYQCGTHCLVFDGWPAADINGGTIGSNADYNTMHDMIYFTKTQALGGGGGPNTINVNQTIFVTAGTTQCFVRWGGMTGSGGLVAEFRFTDTHFEAHTDGSGTFCSDATVPLLNEVFITGSLGSTFNTSDGHFFPLFNLNALTALSQFHMDHNEFDNCVYSGSPNMFHLAPTPASGASFTSVHLTGNTFCTGPTFAANSGANYVVSSANQYGALGISGTWSDFESAGDDFDGLVEPPATGKIAFAGAHPQSWTPTLTFSGSGSSGVSYSVRSGTYQRTADGGYTANFNIVLIGVTGISGNATIAGIPYQCGGVTTSASGAWSYVTGMIGLTGAPSAPDLPVNTASPAINLYQSSPTGIATMSAANFGTGSTLIGEVHCAQTH